VNVIALAHDLGLNVWGMHTLDPSISGKIFRDPMNGGTSGFSIAVNATEAYTRQRFTIAHEIAHFILHRSKLEAGDLVDDSIYRSGLSSKEEADANRLAADILMPRPLISRMVSAGNRDVQTLANQFQVSIPAMQIRLGIPVV
jgi:Zn-dependent peptidase ImmA (M78 family)